MEPEQYQRVRQLFHEVCDLPAEARRRHYRDSGATDAMIAEVEALIGDDGREGLLEESRLGDVALRLVDDHDSRHRRASNADPAHVKSLFDSAVDSDRDEDEREGGRYRVEGEVARGGMGTILRAWDPELKRHLAVKVLRGTEGPAPSFDASSADRLRRFVKEAQLTGQLDHPGVVPVHELDLDDEGRVFFSMRLVEGITLGEVFERVRNGVDGWTRTRALSVVLRACETVDYAHSRGIVHRDLKSSNIMVGSFGETYVMDWGLAKHQGSLESAGARPASPPMDAAQTLDGAVLGTPAFMPPEQARGELDAVGPHSDVYSMGAVLLHLLSGRPPFVGQNEDPSFDSVLMRVLEGPSPDVGRLAPDAPVELAAICERALQRDPAGRYPSMHEMAEDLRAFLEQRVVKAYRTGPLIEAKKWVQRNKALAAALAFAFVAVVGGVLWTALLQTRHTRALEAKNVTLEAANERIQREALTSTRVVDFLVEMFEQGEPRFALGEEITVKEVLDRKAASVANELADEPLIRSRLMSSMGAVYTNLGLYDEAERLLRAGVEVASSQAEGVSEDVLRARKELATLLYRRGGFEEAEELLHGVLDGYREHFDEDHPDALDAAQVLAIVVRGRGRIDEAIEMGRALAARMERVLGEDDPATLTTLANLASHLTAAAKFDEAGAIHDEVIQKRRRILGDLHPGTLSSISNYASYYKRINRIDLQIPLVLEAYEGRKQVFGDDHPYALEGANNLAAAYNYIGYEKEALEIYLDTLPRMSRVLGDDHTTTISCRCNLATCYNDLGRPEEAVAVYREVLEDAEASLEPGNRLRLIARNGIAWSLHQQGDNFGAAAIVREMLDEVRGAADEDPVTVATILNNLGHFHQQSGHVQEALAFRTEAFELLKRVFGLEYHATRNMFGDIQDLHGMAEREARASFGDNDPRTGAVLLRAARFDRLAGDPVQAMARMEGALTIARLPAGIDGENALALAVELAELYLENDRLGEALEMVDGVLELTPDAAPERSRRTALRERIIDSLDRAGD